MSFRKNFALLLVCCLLAFSDARVRAQGPTTGSIEGTVKDQNGAVIPGAEGRIINKATTNERKVTTDEAGHYALPFLPPGVYRIGISASGFSAAVIDTGHVFITATTSLDADLLGR